MTSKVRTKCPRPECDSSDGLATYDDHTWCYACNTWTPIGEQEEILISEGLIEGKYTNLTLRRITEETCRRYGYMVGNLNGRPVTIANYQYNGKVVAQKYRTEDKDFPCAGQKSKIGLWGSWIWGKGKRIAITEGLEDAMSVNQALGGNWPAVSISFGAGNAEKEIKANLRYLDNFEQIVLMFDMDDEGQKAALACAKILPVGKVCIANLPTKDANEMLQEGREHELFTCFWQAKPYKPEGIISHDELYEKIITEREDSDIAYPWPMVNCMTHGIRTGKIVVLAAGTSAGKSSAARQIGFSLLKQGGKVGFILAEEPSEINAQLMVGLELNKRVLMVPGLNRSEEFKLAYDSLIRNRAVFCEHSWSLDKDSIVNEIRYMALGDGCKYIIVDPLSRMMTTEWSKEQVNHIDNTVNKLQKLAIELDICIIAVMELHNISGNKGHEDGEKVSMTHLKGSSSLRYVPDIILALQIEKISDLRSVHLEVLKNRFDGVGIGRADDLEFNATTGHLLARSKF